jgi:hypothetical protein
MTVKDHRGRALDVPALGQVTVLSFASKSTADQASARCRAVRVTHPDVTILELMDVSSVPGFMAGKVEGKLAERHETIVADTKAAFAAAHAAPPDDPRTGSTSSPTGTPTHSWPTGPPTPTPRSRSR